MAKRNYLEKYFDQHNDVKERLTINKKITFLFISFAICSILYLLITSFGKEELTGDLNTIKTIKLYVTIMNITYFVSLFGIGIIVLLHLKKIKIKFKFKKALYNVLDWLIILPICVVISSFFFNFIFSVTEVSGDSMYPTISNGETLVLNYTSNFKRGDIVVIGVTKKHNKFVNEDKYYIKRIIGLPGEQIQFKEEDGMVNIYINGEIFNQSFYHDENSYQNFDLDSYYGGSHQLKLDLNGDATFEYLDYDGNEQSTKVIPQGFYFVLGDNRRVSNDSRQIGLIRKTDIVGVTKYRTSENFIFYWRKIK